MRAATPSRPGPADAVTILVVGDSHAAGAGVRRGRVILRPLGGLPNGEQRERFDQRQRLDQLGAPLVGARAQRAAQLPQRLAALALRLGHDQVGEALDRGEIELAVLKGAPRELARLRWP